MGQLCSWGSQREIGQAADRWGWRCGSGGGRGAGLVLLVAAAARLVGLAWPGLGFSAPFRSSPSQVWEDKGFGFAHRGPGLDLV